MQVDCKALFASNRLQFYLINEFADKLCRFLTMLLGVKCINQASDLLVITIRDVRVEQNRCFLRRSDFCIKAASSPSSCSRAHQGDLQRRSRLRRIVNFRFKGRIARAEAIVTTPIDGVWPPFHRVGIYDVCFAMTNKGQNDETRPESDDAQGVGEAPHGYRQAVDAG